MMIKRETDYAVRAILYIAQSLDGFATVREVSKAQSIPRDFSAKVLQKLARAGVLESVRGVNGGYRLKKGPSELSLFDVLEAMEGPTVLNQCVLSGDLCERTHQCPVHPFWVELSRELSAKLREITFDKIIEYEKSMER